MYHTTLMKLLNSNGIGSFQCQAQARSALGRSGSAKPFPASSLRPAPPTPGFGAPLSVWPGVRIHSSPRNITRGGRTALKVIGLSPQSPDAHASTSSSFAGPPSLSPSYFILQLVKWYEDHSYNLQLGRSRGAAHPSDTVERNPPRQLEQPAIMSEGDVAPPKMVVAEAHNIGKANGTFNECPNPNRIPQIPTTSPRQCSSEYIVHHTLGPMSNPKQKTSCQTPPGRRGTLPGAVQGVNRRPRQVLGENGKRPSHMGARLRNRTFR